MKLYQTKAFTLVELIVVIVILGILGTIGLTSFQGYSTDARDTKRTWEIINITKNMEFQITKTGQVPIPENSLTITSNGTPIGYQGFAGEKVLGAIGMYGGGKDPLDDEYYTYLTNIAQNKYQILGFLEQNPFLSQNLITQTWANDFSNRIPFTKGNKIGILMEADNQQPVNYQTGSIDVADLGTTEYSVVFSNQNSIRGSGNALAPLENTYGVGGISNSCLGLLEDNAGLNDGTYYLIDSRDNDITIKTCNMTIDGGGWTFCNIEGQECEFDDTTGEIADLLYISSSDDTRYNILYDQQNDTVCNNALFGDPHPGVWKHCYYR